MNNLQTELFIRCMLKIMTLDLGSDLILILIILHMIVKQLAKNGTEFYVMQELVFIKTTAV